MNTDNETTAVVTEVTPAFYLGDMDTETFDILIDDKIATGG